MKGLTSTFIAYYETLTELTDNPFIQYSNIHTVDCKSVTWCMYAWEFLFAFLFHFISFHFYFYFLLSFKELHVRRACFFFSPAKCKNTEYKKNVTRGAFHTTNVSPVVVKKEEKKNRKWVTCWWDENWNTEPRLPPLFLCIYCWVHENILNKTQQSQHLNPRKVPLEA